MQLPKQSSISHDNLVAAVALFLQSSSAVTNVGDIKDIKFGDPNQPLVDIEIIYEKKGEGKVIYFG